MSTARLNLITKQLEKTLDKLESEFSALRKNLKSAAKSNLKHARRHLHKTRKRRKK